MKRMKVVYENPLITFLEGVAVTLAGGILLYVLGIGGGGKDAGSAPKLEIGTLNIETVRIVQNKAEDLAVASGEKVAQLEDTESLDLLPERKKTIHELFVIFKNIEKTAEIVEANYKIIEEVLGDDEIIETAEHSIKTSRAGAQGDLDIILDEIVVPIAAVARLEKYDQEIKGTAGPSIEYTLDSAPQENFYEIGQEIEEALATYEIKNLNEPISSLSFPSIIQLEGQYRVATEVFEDFKRENPGLF